MHKNYHSSQNFGIRKFTIGTASILLGTGIFLSISHDADASETTTPEPVTAPAVNTTSNSYKIGDYAWIDADADGIQGAQEQPLANVKIELSQNGKTISTTTTDANGQYLFTNVANGTYELNYESPEGYTPTQSQAGEDSTVDSNNIPGEVIINNADDLTVDVGYLKDAPTPVAKYSLGNFVWNDLNHNGIQDKDEPGLKDVQVTLTKPDASTQTTTTNDKGIYEFKDLPNGKYKVAFITPIGFEPTLTGQGDLDIDSNGVTAEVEIADAYNSFVDSGFYQKEVALPKKDEPIADETKNNQPKATQITEVEIDYSTQLLEQPNQYVEDSVTEVTQVEKEISKDEDFTDYSTLLLETGNAENHKSEDIIEAFFPEQTYTINDEEDYTDYSTLLLEQSNTPCDF